MRTTCFETSFPADLEAVREIQRHWTQIMHQLGLHDQPGGWRHNAMLCTIEAVANAVLHGKRKDKRRHITRVDVELRFDGHTLEITIADNGPGMRDFSRRLRRFPAHTSESGRGLAIIDRLCDRMRYTRGEKKNQLVLQLTAPRYSAHKGSRRRRSTRRMLRHCGRSRETLERVVLQDDGIPLLRAVPSPPGRQRGGQTVLLLDADAGQRVALGRVLTDAHHSLQTASNETQLFAALKAPRRIALVLLDLATLAERGVETIRRLRCAPQHADLGIIVITDPGATSAASAALDAGADDFVNRPIDGPALLARVRAVTRLRRLDAERRIYLEKMQRDLVAAQELQLDMIPSAPLSTAGLFADWRYVPSRYVGGDMLGVTPVTRDKLAFYVADVAGHGVAAAMLAIWVHHFLRPRESDAVPEGLTSSKHAALRFLEPDRVLRRMDRVLDEGETERYLTAVYGVIDGHNGKLAYSVAGHPRPIIVGPNGSCRLLDQASTPVGLGLELDFAVGHEQLAPDERLFVYTDGISEAAAPHGALFGTQKMQEALLETRTETLSAQLDSVLERTVSFTQNRGFEDDVTLLGVRFDGPAERRSPA